MTKSEVTPCVEGGGGGVVEWGAMVSERVPRQGAEGEWGRGAVPERRVAGRRDESRRDVPSEATSSSRHDDQPGTGWSQSLQQTSTSPGKPVMRCSVDWTLLKGSVGFVTTKFWSGLMSSAACTWPEMNTSTRVSAAVNNGS